MPPVIAGLAVLLVAVGVPATIATGVAIGILVGTAVIAGTIILSVLLKPKTASNAASTTRLNQQLDPDAFRKIVLGQTAAGNDLIYWEVYGTGSKSYDQVIAKAGHAMTAPVQLYLEGVAVNFSGATCTTAPYDGGTLNSYTTNKGVSGANPFGTTVGSGTYWTAASSMTGMGGRLLKWLYDQTKLPGGVPSRVCDVWKGSPVYDPRKDTTVGGSGTHRANDNTTWQYTPTDSNGIEIGRNNALQMLRYLLGWTINGVKIDGRGVDPADIDYANWIAAANVCETQQYYTDCILSTGDTHSNNEAIIANGAQGILLDSGGLWSYYPAYDDTASIAVAFTADDIISGAQWNPKASMGAAYNQVGGNFVDPSTTNLYVPQPYPTIKDATYLSNDGGFGKRLTLDFQNVQNAALAQKLARIALNKTRTTGTFQATFNFKALQAVNYNCVTLTFPNLGWVNKLFRITSMAINPIGGIDLTLQEEFSTVYTGGTVNTYTPVGGAPPYDRTQAIAVSGLALTSVNLQSANVQYAVDGIGVTWTQSDNNVKSVEVEYQPSLIQTFDITDARWLKQNCSVLGGQTDRFGGTSAYKITSAASGDFKVIFADDNVNVNGRNLTTQTFMKQGNLAGPGLLVASDKAFSSPAGASTAINTSTYTFIKATQNFVAGSYSTGLRVAVDLNGSATAANQNYFIEETTCIDENAWHMLPKFSAQNKVGVVIPNLLPNAIYVVRIRFISVNDVPGPWSEGYAQTVGYSSGTQNVVFNSATDPAIGGTFIPNNSFWNVPGGATYLRFAGAWVLIASSPQVVPGQTIHTDTASGNLTMPGGSYGNVIITLKGGDGGVDWHYTGFPTYAAIHKGGLGGTVVTKFAVTPGSTNLAWVLGGQGTDGFNAAGGNGGSSTMSSPAITANGGNGATTSADGTGGTASGGTVSNTTGTTGGVVQPFTAASGSIKIDAAA